MRRIDLTLDINAQPKALKKPKLRFLVVEDSWLLAMGLQDMLAELNCSVDAVASDLDAALSLAASGSFDAAILDYWLHDRAVTPVAKTLLDRGVPFAIATGYGVSDIAADLRHVPVLVKPYIIEDVRGVLEVLGSMSTGQPVARAEKSTHLTG